jgi:hypothetical protein
LLVASLGPEVIVAINSICGDILGPMIEQNFGLLPRGILFVAIVVLLLLTFLISAARWVFSRSVWTDRTKWVFEVPNLTVSAVAGVFLAIGLYDCAAFIGSERVTGALLILGGVLVAAIAYAMQFVSDRLAWAGEMRGYADALEIFRRASAALKAIDSSEIAAAERTVRQNTVIEALGKEALKENESWLRTHRERPLEPLPPA